MQSEISPLFLVIAGAFLGLLLVIFVISFLLLTQKRSFRYQESIAEMKKQYESAILKSQVEVQAQTLQHISEEIHDNIGQMMQAIRLNLTNIARTRPEDMESRINETKEIVVDIIAELRHLSKSISSKRIADFGLYEAISYQVSRINKTNEINATLTVEGENKTFDPDVELVLFRMVQEALNNAIKHSGGNTINVKLAYFDKKLTIAVSDNGKGFSGESSAKGFASGSGLFSLKEKAKNINCDLTFASDSNGTTVQLIKSF